MFNMPGLIDLDEVKRQADFLAILDHYGIKIGRRKAAKQVMVLCPFHDDREPSLSINTEANIYNCFGCRVSGSVIRFVEQMDQISSLPIAAGRVWTLSGYAEDTLPRKAGDQTRRQPPQRAKESQDEALPGHRAPKAARPAAGLKAPGNGTDRGKPLNEPIEPRKGVELGPHPYLLERGLSERAIVMFGLGFGAKGRFLKDRIAIPIHDEAAQLVAYTARWPGNDVPQDERRYNFPEGFYKSLVLYNLFRLEPGVKHVVLVEGFFACIRLYAELGVPAVASIGNSLSEEQVYLLTRQGINFVTVLYDGDPGGRAGAEAATTLLSQYLYVHNATAGLPDGSQPDEMDLEELAELVALPSLS